MNPMAIAAPVWYVLVHVAITSLTDVLIRLMFARRVWRLSQQNFILTGLTIGISLTDLICGLIITVKAFGLHSFTELSKISTLLYINFIAGFSGDFLVAVVLCWYLYRSRTGFQRTDTLVKTLVSYIITTGLLTAIDASLGMIFYIVMPNNFIFIAFYFNLAKMYINSYLALLNARERLGECSAVSIHLSRISERPFGTEFSSTAHSSSVCVPSDEVSVNMRDSILLTKSLD
ncbi:hypothetical protein BJ138DRAFT_1158251 [Hygrophoropsis aurantiaca]|uniref:Uncharacterized protein n=1 Tax=Hygrophoropsis aurantiaca TaxID=72124 RepID=A0ACB8A560_9AGAM|nr:hypothetical protein BJ138DRAFT_1158251 [Hygrophoropsis aurantiaca]